MLTHCTHCTPGAHIVYRLYTLTQCTPVAHVDSTPIANIEHYLYKMIYFTPFVHFVHQLCTLTHWVYTKTHCLSSYQCSYITHQLHTSCTHCTPIAHTDTSHTNHTVTHCTPGANIAQTLYTVTHCPPVVHVDP